METNKAKITIAIIEISSFLKENGYTYKIPDLKEGLRKRKEGYYNSYTMDHCLDNLTESIEVLNNEI